MRESVVTAVRYSFRLRREVVFRLTYSISEGPQGETDRWFLVRQEEEEWKDVAAELGPKEQT
jgi:hypothetical protein